MALERAELSLDIITAALYPTEEVQSLQHQAQSPFASIRTTPAPLAVLYVHELQPEPLRQRQTSPQPLPVLVTTRHFSL